MAVAQWIKCSAGELKYPSSIPARTTTRRATQEIPWSLAYGRRQKQIAYLSKHFEPFREKRRKNTSRLLWQIPDHFLFRLPLVFASSWNLIRFSEPSNEGGNKKKQKQFFSQETFLTKKKKNLFYLVLLWAKMKKAFKRRNSSFNLFQQMVLSRTHSISLSLSLSDVNLY